MQRRWKITLEYDGSAYAGWQRQESGVPSVQLAVEDAIEAFCQQRLTIHVAGRTDAGVHARGQVAHLDLDYGDRPLEGYTLAMALNAQLKLAGHRVAVLRADAVADDFHARFSATNKLYCYRIINRMAPPVLEGGLVWHIRKPLDVAAMRAGAAYLIGHHDFTTFRDSECQAKSPMKTLDRFDIETDGDEIRCMVEGRSFLHHQVRNMVGTLERVGTGKWQPEDIRTALEQRDRTKGGQTAPADGLYLMRVDY